MTISYRPTHPGDADIIGYHRDAMFHDMGTDDARLKAMRPVFRDWVRVHLETDRFFGFIAEDDGKPVGCVSAFILDWPPSPWHPETTERAYIFNVNVDATHRRQGIARMLMQMIEAEIKRRGIAYAALRPSAKGQQLYEAMGWHPTGEMAKDMRPA